jgi:hypothetical protein
MKSGELFIVAFDQLRQRKQGEGRRDKSREEERNAGKKWNVRNREKVRLRRVNLCLNVVYERKAGASTTVISL